MHNKALENTVFVLAAGAFGVFVRWLQLQLAFDEKGLCGASVFNVIVPVFILIVAWVLRRRIAQLLKVAVMAEDYSAALRNEGRFYAFLRWLVGAVMMLGGVLIIRGSEVEKRVIMLRLLGGLAILSGICFPLYLGAANRELKSRKRNLVCLLGLAPILMFSLWLVYDYMDNAINSVIWAFLIEVLAVSTLMLAFFRLAGFAYGQVQMKKTLFWLQFGVFMSLTVLADSRSMGRQIVFFAAGLMLALADFILLKKLREKTLAETLAEEKAKEKPDGGIERL